MSLSTVPENFRQCPKDSTEITAEVDSWNSALKQTQPPQSSSQSTTESRGPKKDATSVDRWSCCWLCTWPWKMGPAQSSGIMLLAARYRTATKDRCRRPCFLTSWSAESTDRPRWTRSRPVEAQTCVLVPSFPSRVEENSRGQVPDLPVEEGGQERGREVQDEEVHPSWLAATTNNGFAQALRPGLRRVKHHCSSWRESSGGSLTHVQGVDEADPSPLQVQPQDTADQGEG